jgi:YHS domain-containing protein
MACIDIEVDPETPFADYGGKRFYFCSDECKAEFQKNPSKFAQPK